jgi:cytidylate kinase
VADSLGYTFLDTGAFFRALTLKAVREGAALDDECSLAKLFDNTKIEINGEKVLLDGEDVSDGIRKPGIAEKVGPLAAFAEIRGRMVERWRAFAKGRDVVTEGRDQGSVVFPDAAFKFFLTASIEERVRRRHEELRAKGTPVDIEKLRSEIILRDERDKNRNIAPLRRAGDAVLIDTTGLTAGEVTEEILRCIRGGR